jgi:hypothetical protein
MKYVQATGEVFSCGKRTSSISKHEISPLFLFCGSFLPSFLDADPLLKIFLSSFISYSIVVLLEREDNEKKNYFLTFVMMQFHHTSRILIKLLCSHTRIFPTMLCQIIVLCQLIAFPLCDHAIYQNANYICEALCPLHFFSFLCHCIAVHQ